MSECSSGSPKVGILMPCFNHAEYVQAAIESVVSQDYENKVLVIVDDASTDSSTDIILDMLVSIDGEKLINEYTSLLTGYITKDKLPVMLARHSINKKRPTARNTALKVAWELCDYFIPLDADDLLFYNKISVSMKSMMEDPINVGLVYSDDIIHNIKTGVDIYNYRRPFDRTILEQENYLGNCPLINKQAMGFVGMYDEKLEICEDWDMWLRMTESFIAIHIPVVLSQYNNTGDNCTFTFTNEQWYKYRSIVINKMLERKKHASN